MKSNVALEEVATIAVEALTKQGDHARVSCPAEDLRWMAVEIQTLRAALAKAEVDRDEWCRQCNMASEAQADALNDAAKARAERGKWRGEYEDAAKFATQYEAERDEAQRLIVAYAKAFERGGLDERGMALARLRDYGRALIAKGVKP